MITVVLRTKCALDCSPIIYQFIIFLSSTEADLSQDVSDLGAGLEKGEDGKIRLRRTIREFHGRDLSQGFHLILLYLKL